MAYFIRHSGDDCTVIRLYPDDREEVIPSGLAIGDAEVLCVNKIERVRISPGLTWPDTASAPRPRLEKHERAAAGVSIRLKSVEPG